MAYYYYHPLGENGQDVTPSPTGVNGQVTFAGSSTPILAMCEGTATVGVKNDGTSYCYISNSNVKDVTCYFEYLHADFSITDGTSVTKGQEIGTSSDKGCTGTDQIAINLTIDTNGTPVTGTLLDNTWNGNEIDSSIVVADAQAWALQGGFADMAYNYLIFAGPLKIMTQSGAIDGWNYAQDWDKGIEGYYTKNGKTYSIYKQGRGSWGGMSFAGGTVTSKGCSITCMAIICSGLVGNITPVDTMKSGVVPRKCYK